MSDNYDISQLKIRKVEMLLQQAPTALGGSFLVAIILYTLLLQQVVTSTLIAWFGLFTLLTICRLAGVIVYQRKTLSSDTSRSALKLYALGTILAGFMWGILSVYLLGILNNELIYFMLICVVGLTAASVATYSTSHLCFLFFMVPALAPLTYALFTQDDYTLNAVGILLVLYTASLLLSSIRVNRLMIKALKFELVNERLAEEKRQVSQLNEDLKNEIEKRTKTEQKLLEEKEKAQALTEEMTKLSSLDGLTKISNRRGFDDYLDSEWNRALRNQSPLALILCDIDFFKSYNDTYGHQAGDDCLVEVAIVLESFARRAGDFVARYGGEEFAILLPHTELDVAENIAEMIRLAILDLKILHDGSQIMDYVTLSFGVCAMVPAKNQIKSLLVSQADKALYQSKKAGKNITTCCIRENAVN